MAKQTKRRRSKKRRSDLLFKYKLHLALMAGAAFVVVALIFFAKTAEQPKVTAPPKVLKPKVDHVARVYAEVETLFSRLNVDAASIQRNLESSPADYTVTADFPPAESLDAFARRLKGISKTYSLLVQEQKTLLIDRDGQVQVRIEFIAPEPEYPDGPLITIIMDDLGRSRSVAQALTDMEEPVTFSILPGESLAAQVAEIGYAAGHEIMLHVPMEPQGYPAVNPGSDALFVKYGDEEIRARFDQLLSLVPHVSGTNNHMGSRFTEDSRALAPVMKSLREKGLFFIDSRTTGQSKVTESAEKFGVPTMSRDVFLDNVAEVDAIVKQIHQLERKAHDQGQAIGICHPYPETLTALRQELPKLRERGFTIVPVSALLRKKSSAQGS